MQSEKSLNCELSEAITRLYTFGVINASERTKARNKLGTIEDCSIVEHGHDDPTCKKFLQVEAESCYACNSLPCDWVDNPWVKMPWVVTLKESGGQRFLIDKRIDKKSNMFSGFKVSRLGALHRTRENFHSTHFIEVLPQ